MLLTLLLSVVFSVTGQQDFDRLGERIDSVLAAGEREMDVCFAPGTYFFRDGHLRLSGVQAPDAVLRLRGNGAVLVGAQDGTGPAFENGFVDLEKRKAFEVLEPVKKAGFWPVRIPFRKGLYVLRCKGESDVSEADAAGMKLILSQWFVGAVYDVVKISRGWVWFRRVPYRTRIWSELRFGRCLPRYMLFSPRKAASAYPCAASNFLTVENSRLGGIQLDGLHFLGNGAGEPLLDFRDVHTDSVRVDSCRFEGVRSQVFQADSTDHIRLRNNFFQDCYLGAVRLSAGVDDALVEGNRFIDNGLQMTNTPIVDCKGQGFLVRENYFEDFSYSAVGVGLHFSDSTGCITSGVVEDNEICMSEAFRTGVPRELIDGGAIYVWTQNRNVVIRNNYIHDIDGPHGNRGIFADDGAVNVEVSGNLLLNIPGGRDIDLRRAFRVERKRSSVIRRVNVGNRMDGNILDGAGRFYVRKDDPTSFKGDNIHLSEGYDRETVVREWKNRNR